MGMLQGSFLPEHASDIFNSFLTDDDTRSFCGQCISRSDCTDLRYTLSTFSLYIITESFLLLAVEVYFKANEKLRFICSVMKELIFTLGFSLLLSDIHCTEKKSVYIALPY